MAHWHAPSPRRPAPLRGITLLEVLFSILILAIGLLSVAALLPVGRLQAGRALVDQNKVTVGVNAFNEFRIRNMADPGNWVNKDPATQDYQPYLSNIPIPSTDAIPVAIDPLMVSRHEQNLINYFPAKSDAATNLRFPRISLTNLASNTPSIAKALADEVFFIKDDLQFQLPDDPTLPPVGGFGVDGKKRTFEGQFSWMATLVPEYGETYDSIRGTTGTPTNLFKQNLYRLSIVVFHRRNLSEAGLDNERFVNLIAATPQTPGGGEIVISLETSTEQKELMVTPGQWVLLGAKMTRPLTGGGTYNVPIFKWYRIVSAGEIKKLGDMTPPLTPAGQLGRRLTVAGPDWGNAASLASGGVVGLFDGVVAVYEKTIRLEGNNAWSVAP